MSKAILSTLILLFVSGCATKQRAFFSETMLPDGRTWEVKSNIPCNDYADKAMFGEGNRMTKKEFEVACNERLYAAIEKYGTELCGTTPQRVFNCGSRGDENFRNYGRCYVKCPADK